MRKFQDLLRAMLNDLRRERDGAVGFIQGLDRRTLQDIGMDHYGITSIVFPDDLKAPQTPQGR